MSSLFHDRFLRACRREPVDRTPLWIMRQAGRYLPEYRELRSRADFLTVCRTPELAVEATLQPLRRFPLDAAILFSDILVPLEALGVKMTFSPGPTIAEPLRTRMQVDALAERPAAEAVPYVAEAVRLLRQELDGRTPLIGFCGAPFTLAAYLIEGRGKEGFGEVKKMLYQDPTLLERLLARLSAAMADYLALQIQSGAQAVQIFDSWAGLLGPAEYKRFALPYVRAIVESLRPFGAPVIYFVNAAPHLLAHAATSRADVIGLCWRTPLDVAAGLVGSDVALQGNLDPHVLFADESVIRQQATAVMNRVSGRRGHIMNLGHGILPDTPIAGVEALIAAVQEYPIARPALELATP
jgi:uroporphyrinogen decarboxylase